MAKPSDLFRWATGVSAITAPAEAKRTAGWIFAERPPPKVMNWLFNGAFQWHTYVDNLHNEPEFLNKNYTWTGTHSFNGQRVNVNTTLEINGTFTRFNNISPQLVGPSNDLLYNPLRPKSILLPLPPQISITNTAGGAFGWTGADGWVVTDHGDCPYTAEIDLPSGCVITGFIVFGRTQGSPGLSGLNFRAGLYKQTPHGLSGGAPDVVPLGLPEQQTAASGAGFGSDFLIGHNNTGLAEVVDRNNHKYFVKCYSCGAPAAIQNANNGGDRIYSIYVSFLDPGPRNG